MRAEIIFKDYTIDVVIHPSCATESDFTVNITTGVGPQGYTPKRGIDYWTDEDKNTVIAQAETAAVDAAEPVAADAAKNTANAILSDPAYKASIKGDKGDTGDPGYTPKRGVDYWTETDKEEIVAEATPERGVDYWTAADQQAIAAEAQSAAEVAAEATATEILNDPAYKASIKGDKGDKGDTGDPGYTPKRGIDYWTNADKEEIITDATPVRGVDYWTDADKQIVSTQAEEAAEATAATMLSDPEYKASIKGDPGEPGYTPIKGIDYFDGAKGDPGDDYILTAADKEEIAQQTEELLSPVLDTKAPAIWEDASGAIATFADGADDMPLRECVVQIEPVQSGSGDPSPDNVRPISGWTGCNVSRTGKNLLDIHGTVYNTRKNPEGTINLADYSVIDSWAYNGYVRPSRVTTTIQNNSITIVTPDGAYGVGLVAKVKARQKYTFQATHNGNVIFGYYTANCSYISHEPGGINTTYTVTIPAGVEYIIILFRGTGTGTFTISDIQLEPGEIASTYEPFKSSTTYPITWEGAGTVYGGTVNPVTGELVVDRAIVDLGALDYNRTSGSDGTFVFTTGGFAGKKAGIANIISDCLLTTTITSWTNAKPNNSICGSATSTTVVIRADNYENANDLKTALSGHHAVYELTTPIAYQLTPQEIRTLLGTNNIWADTGDIAVTYPADTKMFVEKNAPESPVQDVQVNGVSVLSDGVANVPIANNRPGIVKVGMYGTNGININQNDGTIAVAPASLQNIRRAELQNKPIASPNAYAAAFYGLAKAAGDTTQSASSNTVGNYTESAKSAISKMLSGSVSVEGTTPTINALPGVRYVCGEVSTITISTPSTGIVDVVFESGSTPAVLTVVPPTGQTVKWANVFDPASLEADTVYEVNVMDGCLGVCGTWS